MSKKDSAFDNGIIKIHRNALASIAVSAATEIEGVKGIGSNLKNIFLNVFGKKHLSLAVKVEFDKNGEIKINLPLIIRYGHNIPQVAEKVQENVRVALEKMTNLTIKDININIQGVERG